MLRLPSALLLALLCCAQAGAFAVLPQEMKKDVDKAFGAQDDKKNEPAAAPAAPAADVAAIVAEAKAAQEAAEKAEREAAEKKAAAAAQRKQLGSLAGVLVLAAAVYWLRFA